MAPRKKPQATKTTKKFANGAAEMTLNFAPGAVGECLLLYHIFTSTMTLAF
jgi:hypothetical protein